MTQETIKSDQDVNLVALQQTYESMRSVYGYVTQWTTIMITAWAGLLTLGLQAQPRSGSMILLSGIALLIMAHELNRGGQGLGALWSVAISLERDLGIPLTKSHTIGGLASFRGIKNTRKMLALSEFDDEGEWLQAVSSSEYSIFDIRRSKTAFLAVTVGILQSATALVLMLSGHLSI